jgi:1,4-dihydroxy-2-naphthoyl-CoA hydrolase
MAAIWRDGKHPLRGLDTAPTRDTMLSTLGIEFLEAGDDWLKGRMPVDGRTHQPFGLLHGGASVALAETLASWAGTCAVAADKICVGMEINANHVRPARDGWVYGTATPEALGRTTQVWSIRISDEQDRLVCISRMTLAVVPIPGGPPPAG